MKDKSSKQVSIDTGTCVYGAGVLLKHTLSLAEEVEGVKSGSEDIEYIHRARVASRRLRAAMPLFQSCLPQKKATVWLKEIRLVTKALGQARDADVQIERIDKFSRKMEEKNHQLGIQRLLLRLRQHRAQLQEPVVQAMEQLSRRGVLEDMRDRLQPMAVRDGDVYLYTPTLYQHSFTAINAQLEAFLAYGPIVDQPEKVEELHEMRIVAKKLRYTMETFAPLYGERMKKSLQSVKLAQELLGDIHDCDVWLDYVPAFIEEERQRTRAYLGHDRPMKRITVGILHFEEDRRQTRNDLYEQYVCHWHDWQEEALWENLRATIQTPFFQLLTIEKSQKEPPAAE